MTEPFDRPAISAAIIINDGRLLLVQRRITEGDLAWQLPAGAIEPGESSEDAAVRETSEEVGLEVSASKLLGERVHPKTGRLMVYVACAIISGSAHVADEEELADLVWATPDEFKTYVPYGFAPAVEEYLLSCGLIA